MAYYIQKKDGEIVTAQRKSDFTEVMKEIDADDIEKIIEGVELQFRFQTVPVVTRPPVKNPRKKNAD